MGPTLRKLRPEAQAIYAPFAKGYASIAKLPGPPRWTPPSTGLVSRRFQA
jgi:hypothetical protein